MISHPFSFSVIYCIELNWSFLLFMQKKRFQILYISRLVSVECFMTQRRVIYALCSLHL